MASKNKGITVKTVKNANADPQTPTGTGVQWLNGLDPNVAGLYNNAQQILQDNGAVNAYNQARDNGIQQANRQYNDNARSYYQMYKQNQSRLGENLSRLGVNGGASETAATSLLNNYSGNIYNNSQAKANAINDINMQYDQLIAKNSADIASQLANMYYNLGNGLLTERRQNERDDFIRKQTWKREDYLRKEGYKREDADKAYDRALAQAQYTGDFSVMKQFGWSSKDIKNANKLFAKSNNSTGGGGRYRGGGGYYSKGYNYTDPDEFPDVEDDTGGGGTIGKWSPAVKPFANPAPPNAMTDTGTGRYGSGTVSKPTSQGNGGNGTYNTILGIIRNASTASGLNKAMNALSNATGLSDKQRSQLYNMIVYERQRLSKNNNGSGGGSGNSSNSNTQTYK